MSLLLLFAVILISCQEDLEQGEATRVAYRGTEGAIKKALDLGFVGYNDAVGGDIPEQQTTGDATGTLKVSGQVSHVSKVDVDLRIDMLLSNYRDSVPESDLIVTYETGNTFPQLNLSLSDIPNGSYTGTLQGEVSMSGDLEGIVVLDLTFDGLLKGVGGKVSRSVDTTEVRGTATSNYGIFAVDEMY